MNYCKPPPPQGRNAGPRETADVACSLHAQHSVAQSGTNRKGDTRMCVQLNLEDVGFGSCRKTTLSSCAANALQALPTLRSSIAPSKGDIPFISLAQSKCIVRWSSCALAIFLRSRLLSETVAAVARVAGGRFRAVCKTAQDAGFLSQGGVYLSYLGLANGFRVSGQVWSGADMGLRGSERHSLRS